MVDQLLAMAVAAVPFLGIVLKVLGMLVVVVCAVIKLTPSKADDAALEAIKAIPLVGGLLAALVGKAPIEEKSEG